MKTVKASAGQAQLQFAAENQKWLAKFPLGQLSQSLPDVGVSTLSQPKLFQNSGSRLIFHEHTSTTGTKFSLINYQDTKGVTPVYCAAQNGHATVMELLIDARCDIDVQTNAGSTPLYIAAQKGHAAVKKQLIVGHCNIEF